MMKHFPIQVQSIPRGETGRRGFALIITISLMAFLVLLLITVGTFTRIETEVASYSQKQSIAQEHAKMALEIAIGELQKYAGRDERVTFTADRLRRPAFGLPDVYHPYWTLVGRPQAGDPLPLTALVSGNEFFEFNQPGLSQTGSIDFLEPALTSSGMSPFQAVDDSAGSPDYFFRNQPNAASPHGNYVRLVGPASTARYVPSYDNVSPPSGAGWTAGDVNFLEAFVYAPRIPIRVARYPGLGESSITGGPNALPTGGHIIGHYGYHVADEGVKANLAQTADRYPFQEAWIESDPLQKQQRRQAFFEDLDRNWQTAFDPRYREDDYVRTMTPTRGGFSFLNTFFEPMVHDDSSNFVQRGHYFGENFQPGNLNDPHINPRASAWHRVLTRGQTSKDFIVRDNNPYGFSLRDGDEPGEWERLHHDTTTFSRGVMTSTVNNGGLKADLSRLNQNSWNSDHYAWATARANSRFIPGNPAPDSNLPGYPLGVLQPGGGDQDFSRFTAPVVTHVHLIGEITPPGSYGESIQLSSMEARLGLWNPYDVDLDFSQMGGGVEVRISNPDTGEDPDPVRMFYGFGLYWQETDDEVPPVVSDHYGSWFTEHYPNEDGLVLDYESRTNNPIGFTIDEMNHRFRAGETLLFSTNGEQSNGLAQMVRGNNGTPFVYPTNQFNLVDDSTYIDGNEDVRNVDPNDFDLQRIMPTLYFPDTKTLRIKVVVVDGDGDVIAELLSKTVTLDVLGDLEDDHGIDIDGIRGPMSAPGVWSQAVPGGDEDDPPSPPSFGSGNLTTYPFWTVTNGAISGNSLRFSLGVDADVNVLAQNINAQLPNLLNLNYQGRGDNHFYGHVTPRVLSWDSANSGYPVVMFENAGTAENYRGSDHLDGYDNAFGLSLNELRFMTFYHILRDRTFRQDLVGDGILDYDWDNWTSLTSVGQLRPFGEGGVGGSAFDAAFFSTALLPPLGSDDVPFFHNPRMTLFRGDADATTIRNRLVRDDEAAAHVMMDGAFNVNSTSVKAWAALLNSFAGKDVWVFDPFAGADGDVYSHNFEYDRAPDFENMDSFFSRFPSAPGAGFFGRVADINQPRSIWRNGLRELKPLNLAFPAGRELAYEFRSVINGVPSIPDNEEWHRTAAPAMAEVIVAGIRSHSELKFNSVADFIGQNYLRDTISGPADGGNSNRFIEWRVVGSGELPRQGLNWYLPIDQYPNGDFERIPRAAPSWLSQSDILASIGSLLTARSDTFVIRTYGDAHNPVTGQVEARAWLEAVVQRVPTPVNPDSTGVEPQNPNTDRFGRKFEIVHFRWLGPDEI